MTDLATEKFDGMLLMDGYDDCVIGICERFGQPDIITYDKEKVIHKLTVDGMEYQEAVEFFYFNQIGAWMGETTPCFVTLENNCANMQAAIDKHNDIFGGTMYQIDVESDSE